MARIRVKCYIAIRNTIDEQIHNKYFTIFSQRGHTVHRSEVIDINEKKREREIEI